MSDNRPIKELPTEHAEPVVALVKIGWLKVIAKDDETRSLRLRFTPQGEEGLRAIREGRIVSADVRSSIAEFLLE